MSVKTRNPILAALVAGLSVSLAAPMATAQGAHAQNCIVLPNGARQCGGSGAERPHGQPTGRGQQNMQSGHWAPRDHHHDAPGTKAGWHDRHQGPFPGASARHAALFEQARHSRLPPPPPHQHYRVMDGSIVRVNNDTLKVVAVVGLLSALLAAN